MKQTIIGREGNQPFKINDEYVSRRHAEFSFDENTGIMTLTDLSRPGVGTFISTGNAFRKITHCKVDPTTIVRLGPYFTFRIGQLFQSGVKISPTKEPTPKEDISYLRDITEKYEETKIKLEQKQANINSVRGLSLMATIAGGGISALLPEFMSQGQNIEWYYRIIGPIIAVILLGSLMFYCNKASKDIIKKKNKNEKMYKISFCCPHCHVPFAGRLYENILAESKCPKCKTEFYEPRR